MSIYDFDGRNLWKKIDNPSSGETNYVQKFQVDLHGNLWATGSGWLAYFDGQKWIFVKPSGFDLNDIIGCMP